MCVPFFFFFFFFCRGSNVYLKLTEEYCSCVVKNLNTHVEIVNLYRYLYIYMSGRSVNLTTLFLGRLRPPERLYILCCYISCMMCQWKIKINLKKLFF